MMGCGTALLGLFVAAAAEAMGLFVLFLIAAVLVGIAISSQEQEAVNKWNREIWKPQFDAWERSLMCMRCGNTWELPA